MRLTYLFLSFFTTSYKAENSFKRLFVSLYFLPRSMMTNPFTFKFSFVSRSFAFAREARKPKLI